MAALPGPIEKRLVSNATTSHEIWLERLVPALLVRLAVLDRLAVRDLFLNMPRKPTEARLWSTEALPLSS